MEDMIDLWMHVGGGGGSVFFLLSPTRIWRATHAQKTRQSRVDEVVAENRDG